MLLLTEDELVNGKDYSIENEIITINADVFEKLDAGQYTVIIFSEKMVMRKRL